MVNCCLPQENTKTKKVSHQHSFAFFAIFRSTPLSSRAGKPTHPGRWPPLLRRGFLCGIRSSVFDILRFEDDDEDDRYHASSTIHPLYRSP